MTQEQYNKIIEYFRTVLLPETSFESYVYTVGGCNRDILMHQEPKDIDICIDLVEGGVKFAEYLYKAGYLLHEPVYFPTYGTSSFILKEFPDITIEAVMTRKERYTDQNSRNPETVFGTIEEDAARRDLTINSIYWNISKQEYYDPNGGIQDIADKVLRTPQDPEVIFEDDPLRILRVLRFSLRFPDYKITDDLKRMIVLKRYRLNIITQERITSEIMQMLNKHALSDFIWIMKEYKMGSIIFPEINEVFSQRAMKELFYGEQSGELDDEIQKLNICYKLAILFMYANNILFDFNRTKRYYPLTKEMVDMTDRILKKMKFSNIIIRRVHLYMKLINMLSDAYFLFRLIKDRDYTLRKIEHACEFQEIYNNICICTLLLSEIDTNKASIRSIINEYNESCLKNGEPHGYDYALAEISGDDVIKYCNVQPGPIVKEYLEKSKDIVYRNPKLNRIELIQQLQQWTPIIPENQQN